MIYPKDTIALHSANSYIADIFFNYEISQNSM